MWCRRPWQTRLLATSSQSFVGWAWTVEEMSPEWRLPPLARRGPTTRRCRQPPRSPLRLWHRPGMHVTRRRTRCRTSPTRCFAAAIASVLGRWIDANAHASGQRSTPAPDDPLSQFFSSSHQPFTLLYYVRRLVTHTRCSRSAYVAAFVYLDRLAAVAPALAVRSMNIHRLLLAALVVAVKVLDDDVYSAAYYCRVGGIPSVGEYVTLEATLLRLLGFRVAVGVDVYNAYEKGILRAAASVGLFSGEGSAVGSGDSAGL
eukprot:TRINITY_DN52_c1_g1_i7.p3 TRINITY_DN52_c1_g1~~TRINITY_DN52_c1_g1_i7.p3  ORF type:complete len:259 (+),score=44.54 TRINITY_DN52_c1_g1_i7:371-1147(+)